MRVMDLGIRMMRQYTLQILELYIIKIQIVPIWNYLSSLFTNQMWNNCAMKMEESIIHVNLV